MIVTTAKGKKQGSCAESVLEQEAGKQQQHKIEGHLNGNIVSMLPTAGSWEVSFTCWVTHVQVH